MAYWIRFEFDAEGDPPRVIFYDDEDGADVVEVFEEPMCTHSSGWSRNGDDWIPGPIAQRLEDLLSVTATDEEEEVDDDLEA